MKQKLVNHFKKHHRLYKVLGNMLCYGLYYILMMFIAYLLKLDLKMCVWVIIALWAYPVETQFERFYERQRLKELKEFSEKFNRDIDGNFGI